MKPTVFPEVLLDGFGYRIQSGTDAHTDKLTKIITVPYGEDPSDQFVRLHELAHVKWTPAVAPNTICKKYRVSPDALQVAEDCRIHIGLICLGAADATTTCLGHKTPFAAYHIHRLRQYLSNPTAPFHERLRHAIHALVSFAPFPIDYKILLEIMKIAFGDKIKGLSTFLGEFRDAIAHKFFEDLAASYSPSGLVIKPEPECKFEHFHTFHTRASSRLLVKSEPVPIPRFEKSIEVAAWLDALMPADGHASLSLPSSFKKDLDTAARPPRSLTLDATGFHFGNRADGWGVVYYETPPMTPQAHIVRLLNTKVPSDMGTRLRSLDRIMSDSKVFERRKKLQGGTVLVDCSGSMSWSEDDLLTLLHAAPAATVALYAGTTSDTTTSLGTALPRNSGVIRIVVHHGHIAADEHCKFGFGANVIDGPALRWLESQAQPRIWISDGQVTGCNENQYASLTVEVSMICERSRIARLDNLEEALLTFRDLRLRRRIRGHAATPD